MAVFTRTSLRSFEASSESTVTPSLRALNNNPIPPWATKNLSNVPTALNLPQIKYAQDQADAASAKVRNAQYTNPAEGCLVTRNASYSNKLIKWINPLNNEAKQKIECTLRRLKILATDDIDLDGPPNCSYVGPHIEISMENFGLIVITPSDETLDGLIDMVQRENARVQSIVDDKGYVPERKFDFKHPDFTDPQFELVALHPDHFLPLGNTLTIFNPETNELKSYVPASDGTIRESSSPDAPRLKPFPRNDKTRHNDHQVNVFLVALSADLKFKRYIQWERENQATATKLPSDHRSLMYKTMKLAKLIYEKEPSPTEGSMGEGIVSIYDTWLDEDEFW